MQKILIVTGSARPSSVNQIVVDQVKTLLGQRPNIAVDIADLVELDLPYMNATMPPSSPDYVITDERALAWQRLVAEADAVVLVAPEYNHSMSAIQKNAIDWLWREWQQKPVAYVGYGAYGGANAWAQFQEINTVIKTDVVRPAALKLGEAIGYDGTVNDQAALDALLQPTLDELIAKLD